MTASQANAESFNPNELNLTLVASYERLIKAPIVRVWENVLDWEHLPHLHDSSFNHVELDIAGDWGWRTWSNDTHTDHIELTLADNSRYVARTYQGGQQISEIWTTLTESDDNTDILVEFYLPNIEATDVPKLGQLMTRLYRQLWDEDEDMMRERHLRLHETRDDMTRVDLGSEADVRQLLLSKQSVTFQLKRREFQLDWHDERFSAKPTICPHLLGPLSEVDPATNTARCPWHGYVFDLQSGDCISPAHAKCRLPQAPEIAVENTRVIASYR